MRASARVRTCLSSPMNYLNNILARIEASRAGCDEALMLNMDGITRAVVIDVAQQADIRC